MRRLVEEAEEERKHTADEAGMHGDILAASGAADIAHQRTEVAENLGVAAADMHGLPGMIAEGIQSRFRVRFRVPLHDHFLAAVDLVAGYPDGESSSESRHIGRGSHWDREDPELDYQDHRNSSGVVVVANVIACNSSKDRAPDGPGNDLPSQVLQGVQ
jgi:hypothetical protein